ncbi:MAG: hypothetical protein LBR43_01475 [Spiroplasmataceae bacterium]|nr:hypothetical protein [Spiroplasmataceae bacterium]
MSNQSLQPQTYYFPPTQSLSSFDASVSLPIVDQFRNFLENNNYIQKLEDWTSLSLVFNEKHTWNEDLT